MPKADPFSVWGQPPEALAKGLTAKQMKALRSYAQAIGENTYRLAFDNGVSHGCTTVISVAQKELRKLGCR